MSSDRSQTVQGRASKRGPSKQSPAPALKNVPSSSIPPPRKRQKYTDESNPTDRRLTRPPDAAAAPAAAAVPNTEPVAVTKFPEIKVGASGYIRAATALNPFPVPVILPTWLTQPNIRCMLSHYHTYANLVPAIPVLSDPDCLRGLFEAHLEDAPQISDASRTKHQNWDNRRPRYSNFNSMLAFKGDSDLGRMCQDIFNDLFGHENKVFVKKLSDDFLSNDNWLVLAWAYRLDLLLNDCSSFFSALVDVMARRGTTVFDLNKKLISNSNKNAFREVLKFFADCWEMYWGGVLYEREYWGEDIEDIRIFFRQLVMLKYGSLTLFSRENWTARYSHGDKAVKGGEKYSVTPIKRDDRLLENVLGEDKNPTELFGHCAIYPEREIRSIDDVLHAENMNFGIDKEIAVAELLYGVWNGSKGYPYISSLIVSVESCRG